VRRRHASLGLCPLRHLSSVWGGSGWEFVLRAFGCSTVRGGRPDEEGLRARQPTSQITFRGQRVGVWAQPSGVLRGGAPVTLGGKMESASAGPGERAGDGPFAASHLLCRPGYGCTARRAAAPRNEQRSGLFEQVRSKNRGRVRVCLRSGTALSGGSTEHTEDARRAHRAACSGAYPSGEFAWRASSRRCQAHDQHVGAVGGEGLLFG
jgi:hypothetical protein